MSKDSRYCSICGKRKPPRAFAKEGTHCLRCSQRLRLEAKKLRKEERRRRVAEAQSVVAMQPEQTIVSTIQPIEETTMNTESNIMIFNSDNFGDLHVVLRDGEPWFVAKEIAVLLEMRDALTAVRGLDDDERGTHKVCTPGGTQDVIVVSEAGLYSVLVRSNKEIAKPFRRWVTHEVLPSIRKHGAYIVPQKLNELLQKPESIITMLEALKETQEELAEVKPKAERFVRYNETGRNESIGTFAKLARELGIDVGIDEMFKVLRFKRVLCSGTGVNWNQPYTRLVREGLMTTKPIPPEKEHEWCCTPLVTPKGLDYFLPKLAEWVAEYREYFALGRTA